MEPYFNIKLAREYKNPSQKIRVLTENWVHSAIFCPGCGCDIKRYEHNKPVADFYCSSCQEEFELKSKKDNIGKKIINGAYQTMINRLQADNNPNFFLLNYALRRPEVINFFVIPKHFFIPQIIEKRKPLSKTARRAGWVGCNILLYDIPLSGRIYYIRDRKIENRKAVLKKWQKTLFLREPKGSGPRGWILDIMNCIDCLNKESFALSEVYNFEAELRRKHSNNKHIKDKTRQQLQFLRDRGYLEFLGNGRYKKI